MSNQPLPSYVVTMLASHAMREHHATWHLVRARWHRMSAAEKQPLIRSGWTPPRLNPQARPGEERPPDRSPGSGIDFLAMHRKMIQEVNTLLSERSDPGYPRVEGWNPIPWNHNDAEWPMPTVYPAGLEWAKSQQETDQWRQMVQTRYENPEWLRATSLDNLGAEIENGIHNWLHIHWASTPWYTDAPDQDPDDPRNDYLGSTYSSQVNKAFWKLHGWIDDRVTQWEQITETVANLAQGWEGPGHMHDHHHAVAGVEEGLPSLLTMSQLKLSEQFFESIGPVKDALEM